MSIYRIVPALWLTISMVTTYAAPFLTLDMDGKQAYAKAEIVVRGEILQRELQWNVEGKPISEHCTGVRHI